VPPQLSRYNKTVVNLPVVPLDVAIRRLGSYVLCDSAARQLAAALRLWPSRPANRGVFPERRRSNR
jgi:hypothetical protein